MRIYVDNNMHVYYGSFNHLKYLIMKATEALQADTEFPMDGHVAIYRECGELILRHSYGSYRGVARLHRNLDNDYCLTIFAEPGKGAGRLLYELQALADILS